MKSSLSSNSNVSDDSSSSLGNGSASRKQEKQQQQQEEDEIDNGDDDYYLKLIHFQSIRNDDGLEEAITVKYKDFPQLTISTLLEPTELAPLFAGAQWAGTRVWHAAICAIEHLEKNYKTQLKSASFLELGCGLGVPGMIMHQLGSADVYLTDQASIMSQLTKNLQSNFQESNIKALPLNWSKAGIQDLLRETNQGGFDFCLNCDCVYEPLYGSSWKLLIQVMEELLIVNPETVMLTSVERRAADGVDNFLSTLQNSQYVSSVTQVYQNPKYKIEIYLAKGNKR